MSKLAMMYGMNKRKKMGKKSPAPKTGEVHSSEIDVVRNKKKLDDLSEEIQASEMPKPQKLAEGGKVKTQPIKHPKDTPIHGAKISHPGEELLATHEDVEEDIPSPEGLEEDNDTMGDSHAMDDHMQMLAEGGEVSESDQMEHASLTAAIMMKRKKMAEGGMVDLDMNAEESGNDEDQQSMEALKKENYSESEGLKSLSQPQGSKGDSREKSSENKHDKSVVGAIRSKMKARSAISR